MARSYEYKAKMYARRIQAELAVGPLSPDWTSLAHASLDLARVAAKALEDRDLEAAIVKAEESV